MAHNRTKKHQIYIISVVCIGWLITASVFYRLVKHYSSQEWIATQGQIIETDIFENSYERGGTKYHYSPIVKYHYLIENDTLLGSRVAITTPKTNTKSGMEKLMHEYGFFEGNTIPVYYNPENANESALIVESTKSTALTWVMAIFFLFCSIAGIFEIRGKLG